LGFNSAKFFHICDIAKPLYQETNPAHLTLDTAWDSRPVRTSHEEACHILRTAPSHEHSLAIINLPTIIRKDSRYLAQVSIGNFSRERHVVDVPGKGQAFRLAINRQSVIGLFKNQIRDYRRRTQADRQSAANRDNSRT
jgi:hypothetical protein